MNQITISKQVVTTHDEQVTVVLPYYAKEKSTFSPFYYCVVSPTQMVRCCVSQDKKFTAMGIREGVSEAFQDDKVEITREEFEIVFEEAVKIPATSIPKV